MSKNSRPLVGLDVLAEIERLGSLDAVAQRYGCTKSGVSVAARRARQARGDEIERYDCSWDARLRYRPTVKQIER